jgi:hypothetical protein
MKLILSLLIIIGSLVGMAISFMSEIVVDSSFSLFNGMELSMKLGIFFIVVFLGGLSLLFSRDPV